MKDKKTLSICIITFNEEKNIENTLEHIKDIADEIVIVDSYSTDKTVEMCKKYTSNIHLHKWEGFIAQKNIALDKCSSDFILSIDADEEITKELADEIIDKINNLNHDGYIVNRKTKYLGKILKHSWQPDNKLRLVSKDACPSWHGEIVHESLLIQSSMIAILDNHLIHHSYKDIEDHNMKTLKYAKLSAESYHKMGKQSSVFKLLFSPTFNFIKMYVFRLGFLDGIEGLVAARSGYIYTYLKYLYLYELDRTPINNEDAK